MTALAAGKVVAPRLEILAYIPVSKTPSARNSHGQPRYDYVYRVELRNDGTSTVNVTGNASAFAQAIKVIDAEVRFGPVAPGQKKISSDTIQITASKFFDRRLDTKSLKQGRWVFDEDGKDEGPAVPGLSNNINNWTDDVGNFYYNFKLKALLRWEYAIGQDTGSPTIGNLLPRGAVGSTTPVISASYADDASGFGVNPASVKLTIDGVDVSAQSNKTATALSYRPAQPLGQGVHTAVISLADLAGHGATATWTFTVDSIMPVLSAPLPAAASTVSARSAISVQYADLGGTGIDAAGTVLTLDGINITAQALASATGISYTPAQNLAAGNHSVSVSIKDMAGNKAQAQWSFAVAGTGPVAINPLPANGAVLAADAIPVISATIQDGGAGMDGIAATLELDGVNVTALAKRTPTGITYTPAQALKEGAHMVKLSLGDKLGNTSVLAWAFKTAGAPKIRDQKPFNIYLPSGTAPVVSASFWEAGNGIDLATVKLLVNDADVTARAKIDAFGIVYQMPPGLADGSHSVKLIVADKTGNKAESAWVFVTSSPPTISGQAPNNVTVVSDATLNIGAQYADPGVGIDPASVRMFVDGRDVTAASKITASAIRYTPVAQLQPGSHMVVLEVRNKATTPTLAAWEFQVDTPSTYNVVIMSPAANSAVLAGKVDVIAKAGSNKTYPIGMTVNGEPMTPDGPAADDGQQQFSASVALVDGNNVLNVVATYNNGEKRDATAQVRYAAAPVITFTSPLDNVTLGPVNPNSPRDLTGKVERPVVLTGTVSKPATRVTVNQQAAILSNNGTQFRFDNFFLHEGNNVLSAVAVDAQGNTAGTSMMITVDQTAPYVSVESPLKNAVTSNALADVRGVINDAIEGWVGVPYVTVSVVNSANGKTTMAKVSDRYYIAQDVPLEIGNNTLTISALDHVGNSRSQQVNITRIGAGSSRLTLLSGNRQRGTLNTELPKPLTVVALAKDGNPLAKIPLRFDVMRGTGSLTLAPGGTAPGTAPSRNLTVVTDDAGQAQLWFTIGKQSGEAGNMVRVSNPDIGEDVIITASGEKGAPAFILADIGVTQFGETLATSLEPLSAVVTDREENRVPDTKVVFTVDSGDAAFTDASGKKSPTFIAVTDKNGVAVARPDFGPLPGIVHISAAAINPFNQTEVRGARYQISVLQQQDGPTRFSGKVLGPTGQPLPGVRVSIGRTSLSTTADETGYFSFDGQVPPGKLDLFIDGRTANVQTGQYPSLHFEAVAVRGQNNVLPHPIYLPPLLVNEAKVVGGDQDVILRMPGFEGFEMVVKARSVTFPDGSKVGPLVVSPVHQDKLPMVPPGGYNGFMAPAWTIQPSGTRFDPPIEVKVPNSIGMKPGETREIFQWDHDLATFVPMGRSTVTEDGALLVSDANSGVSKAGWGGPPNPPPAPPKCASSNLPKLGPAKIKVTGYSADDDVVEFIGKALYFGADVKVENCTPKYEWDFDGLNREGKTPNFTFRTPKKISLKLKVSCKATCTSSADPTPVSTERDVYATKVEFEEAWSDQIKATDGTVSEANGFRGAITMTGILDKSYALMGVRADNTGRVKVKFKVEPDEDVVRKRLKFGLSPGFAPQGVSGGRDDATGDIKENIAYIKVSSPGHGDLYPVVGIDKDKNGQLAFQEIATSERESKWKFRMVSNDEYLRSLAEYDDGVFLFGWIGRAWLTSFRNGTNPPDGVASDMSLIRMRPGLSHVVGAAFVGPSDSAAGPSNDVTYQPDSAIVKEIVGNDGFKSWIQDLIKTQSKDALFELETYPTAIREYTFSNVAERGIKVDGLNLWRASSGFADLYASVGATNEITVKVRVKYEKTLGVVVASEVELVYGTIHDLFDWDYDVKLWIIPAGDLLPALGPISRQGSVADFLARSAVMARAGAKIQAFHLGKNTSHNGGLVFNNIYKLGRTPLPSFVVKIF
ncbi:hypothetical protein [Massilia scottii]|uniref:hypothetical protein n=1 Tax=Massilia scottii TaxID=3057166 RepID=UPI0027963FC5|nr:hypothetical protein [Massilia sp. CCM 9029]MDQ1832632.1 hypothetical protein [Massilia sp. CCM 9029]